MQKDAAQILCCILELESIDRFPLHSSGTTVVVSQVIAVPILSYCSLHSGRDPLPAHNGCRNGSDQITSLRRSYQIWSIAEMCFRESSLCCRNYFFIGAKEPDIINLLLVRRCSEGLNTSTDSDHRLLQW